MSEQNTVGHTIQRKKIHLEPGHFVERSGIVFKITEVLDFETAVGVNVQTGRSSALRVGELTVVSDSESRHTATTQDIQEIADEDWKIAQQRYAAIKPLLSSLVGRSDIETRSKEIGVNVATIYRWLRRYKSTGVLSALIPQKRGWSEGKSRISLFTEKIIDEVIKDIYLTHQRSSVQKVVTEVLRRCSQRGITPPHATTVRARVNRLSEKQTLRARGYKQKAKNKFSPAPGNFPDPEYPLSVVQIDHTKVDIILVDDVHRKPIGRPWITLSIDIYSRMVTGYYLSFDAPSETSVAMCVAHSILPKDEWLTLLGVDARWDVWGVMDKIHVDNGPDFRSDTFSQSCLMHGINLEFRPPARPNFGGNIERLLGTLLTEIHNLPGTTFSSVKNREDYDSEKHAVMTKSEFEVWLVTLICKIYHQRLHSGIMMPPVKKWEIGIFGSSNSDIVGRGIPPRPVDRHSILLDFLPSFKRTIQVHGVHDLPLFDGGSSQKRVELIYNQDTDMTFTHEVNKLITQFGHRICDTVWSPESLQNGNVK